jgi:hypothetical protein
LVPARKLAKNRKRGPKRVVRRSKPLNRDRSAHEESAAASPPPADSPAPRPTRYDRQLAERILERMANGETATAICRDLDMPKYHVLKRWERDDEDFSRRYDIARKQCCEYHTDEIIAIADDSTNDYIERTRADGTPYMAYNREHVERSRLRVDSRKWNASKILRHVYGEKAEVDLRTPDGINVKVEERNALIDALCRLVQPKQDGKTRPDREDEPRER